MYILDRSETIPTLFGAVAFVAGQPTHVAPEAVREVLRAGAVEAMEQPVEQPEAAQAPVEQPVAEAEQPAPQPEI